MHERETRRLIARLPSCNDSLVLPGIGLAYRISNKLLIDAIPRFHLPLSGSLDGAFVEIPMGIKYAL